MRFPLRAKRREVYTTKLKLIIPVFSVLMAFILTSVILVLLGNNPISVYVVFLLGALGKGWSEIFVKAAPLILTALGVLIPLRSGLWNIGAEGQLHMGAFAASFVALTFPNLGLFMIPTMLFASFLAGFAWGLIPGYLKAYLDINEIISTLMLNYIAIKWVSFLIYGPLQGESSYNFPQTDIFPESAWLPRFFNTRLHLGVFIAIALLFVVYYLLKKTKFGYKLKVVGSNNEFAKYGGIKDKSVMALSLAIGGGVAAIAGLGEVAGVQFPARLTQDISPGYGFTGIVVALLGERNVIGVFLASMFFGFLYVGGSNTQITIGIPASIVDVLQALIILFVISGEFFKRYEIKWSGF